MVPHDWLNADLIGTHSFTFAAIIWWAWRHRNMMCLSKDNWSLHHFVLNSKHGSNLQQLPPINLSSVEEEKIIK